MATIAATATREEKSAWLMRPFNWALNASVIALIWCIPAFANDEPSAKIAIIASLAFIAYCLFWGIRRISNAARGRG